MKRVVTIMISLLILFPGFSQELEVVYGEQGLPIALQITNDRNSKNIKLDSIPEDGLINFDFEGIDITVDFNSLTNKQPVRSFNPINDMIREYEPGISPEGDLVSEIALSTDGSLIFVSQWHSGNIFVYDAETYETMAIIEVALGIIDIHASDSSLYVCCRDARQVFVINLFDYSIEYSFRIDENACQMEVSPDESIVYIGFDSFLDGWMKAYETESGHEVFHTSVPLIHAFGRGLLVGRRLIDNYEFDLSPVGDIFVAHTTAGNFAQVFDAATGEPIQKLTNDHLQIAQFSDSGDTLYFLTQNQSDELILRMINCDDYSTMDSIIVYEESILSCQNMVIGQDGTEVFVPDDFTDKDQFYHFDFDKDTCYVIPDSPPGVPGVPGLYQSTDKRFVFVQNTFNYNVYDMETKQFRGDFPYLKQYEYSNNAVVASDNSRLFVSDFSNKANMSEGWHIVDYSDPDNVTGSPIISGELPEADHVSSITISEDGRKLYTTNTITGNMSIIDMASNTVDTIYDLPAVYERITPIPNSSLVVLSSISESIRTLLFDPVTLSEVAGFDLGRTVNILPSPEGNFLYVTNRTDIYKIELDGENSAVVEQLSIPDFKSCSVFYIFYIIRVDQMHSTFGLSPDGNYIIYGAENDSTEENYIAVVSTETLEVVSQLPVEEACSWDFVFTPDSKRVCVLGKNYAKPIIYIDEDHCYLENRVPDYEWSYSGDYSETENLFYILNYNPDYWKVDPLTGEKVEEVMITDDNEYAWQLVLDKDDIPIIRRNTELIYEDKAYALSGVSKRMYYSEKDNLCLIPIPGPDLACVFDPSTVGSESYSAPQFDYSFQLLPNPATEYIVISSDATFQKVEIVDLGGRKLYEAKFNNRKTTLPIRFLKNGVYLINVYYGDIVKSRKLIISKN